MTSRLLPLLAIAVVLFTAPLVRAQESQAQETNAQTLRTRATLGQDTGVKVSDEAVLHVGVGAEGGYDSNVFYTKGDNVKSSPMLRVTPFVELTNATRGGAKPSGTFFDLSTYLQYREYISSNENIKSQRAFNPTFNGVLDFGQAQRYGFGITDQFIRSEEPPYGESKSNITRNNNVASLQLRAAPGGGRLQAVLRYTNTLDIFSNKELQGANAIGNDVMFDGSWRWLPKTALFFQVSQGSIVYYKHDPALPKENSYPFMAVAGLRGLVTEKLTVNLSAGYAAGYYQGGATSPTGLSHLRFTGESSYNATAFTTFTLGYRHEFRNSVIGTYYDVESPYFSVRQKIGSRFGLLGAVRYEHRLYHGYQLNMMPLGRTDNWLQGFFEATYLLKSWFYAGVTYMAQKNATTLSQEAGGPVPSTVSGGFDYFKYQVLARIGVTY